MVLKVCLLWRYYWVGFIIASLYTAFMFFVAILSIKRDEGLYYLPSCIGSTVLAWSCVSLMYMHCFSWRITLKPGILVLRGCSNACFWFMTYAAGFGLVLLTMICTKSLNDNGAFLVLPIYCLAAFMAVVSGLYIGVGGCVPFNLSSTEIEWTQFARWDCNIVLKSDTDCILNRRLHITGAHPKSEQFMNVHAYFQMYAKSYCFQAVDAPLASVHVSRVFRVHPLYIQRFPTVMDLYDQQRIV